MIIDTPKQDSIPALRALWQESFGDTDTFLDTFYATAYAPKRCRCVYADGKVVAALYWFNCLHEGHRIAYIYAVATAMSHRGRGLCSALMHDTHQHLTDLGYAGAILVPGSDRLFDFYQRLGYNTSSYISAVKAQASDTSLVIRPIGKSEYAKLRRRYLPLGGVIQEDENLNFLETQAALYAGDGFVLAANTAKGELHGVELLGKTDAAGAIVSALGCSVGSFRTAGNERRFAMYIPLGDSTLAPPNYFGLAFD
ncbi:MAG: GNAT family N-acetyltransferase [Clostridia bacterium]|nr:GNAT family N-acetyltransferase [Clostridia bacterium]